MKPLSIFVGLGLLECGINVACVERVILVSDIFKVTASL